MKALVAVLDYLKYPSTWKGIIGLVTAFGVALSPELAEKLIAFGMAGVGFIQVFIDDRNLPK
jgi:hypothetical protein